MAVADIDRYTRLMGRWQPNARGRLEQAAMELRELQPEQKINIYRIIQEQLNNILKHAQANHVDIRLYNVQEQVSLRLTDDGKGFDPSGVSFKDHYGLTGMQERVGRLGGAFSLKTSIGNGTEVHFKIPINVKEKVERI